MRSAGRGGMPLGSTSGMPCSAALADLGRDTASPVLLGHSITLSVLHRTINRLTQCKGGQNHPKTCGPAPMSFLSKAVCLTDWAGACVCCLANGAVQIVQSPTPTSACFERQGPASIHFFALDLG